MEKQQEHNIEKMRHSLSHILASAVKELYPKVKFGIGPAIENGFYYDFDNLKISDSDLKNIQKKMRSILSQNVKFNKKIISKATAKKLFKDQKYKLELINALPGKTVTTYENNGFVDLCKGPHVKSSKEIQQKAFKLTRIAGAYWLSDEKNKMLTRIYGVAFETPKQLKNYLYQLQEAKKRDHRKIGAKLDLFSFHEEAPGMPFFHPKGTVIYKELWKFWENVQKESGYDFVLSPSMLDVKVWKQSGHYSHYKDGMFFIGNAKDKKRFALRPMDCPGNIIIYNNSPKSYKELPIRYAEPGLISRKEQSGELGGLFRVQQFRQDDAHIFLTEEQIESEIKNVIKIVDKIYKPFGLTYKPFLSTRPDNFMGDIKVWDKAEKSLLKVIKEVYGDDYGINEKDGAFYGPKIDYELKDALGRTWQCATIQLDFQMPLKFGCKYTDKNGKEKTPVMIHRTIMGSFERFLGILIEHYAGVFPVWLSPVQVWIVPVGAGHHKYAEEITEKLIAEGIRVENRIEDETVGKKIREGAMQKIPYLLVVGDKEIKEKTVAVRNHNDNAGVMKLDKFTKRIKIEITKKT